MNKTKQKILLQTAAAAIQAVIKKEPLPLPTSNDPALNANCGCFVTIKNHGRLRGCIGMFTSKKPLIELICDMAVAAATRDQRFFNSPLKADELKQLDIEISVLSPLKKINDPLTLRLGIDGIYISSNKGNGCLLPQVATETGWTAEEFLSYCCNQKAGLAPNAWKDAETEVYLFTADVFGAALNDV